MMASIVNKRSVCQLLITCTGSFNIITFPETSPLPTSYISRNFQLAVIQEVYELNKYPYAVETPTDHI